MRISAGIPESNDAMKPYTVLISPSDERLISRFYGNIPDLLDRFVKNKAKACAKKLAKER